MKRSRGGFADAVREVLPEGTHLVPFGWPDEFLPHATSRDDLLARHGLTPAHACAAILAALA